MPILPHLLRQAGTIRRTAQGCMERHCQGCSTIFHPIGVQAIADDYHVCLFFVGKWGMWRKRDEQTWQNWINMALSTSLLEVSVEKKLNYNMDQHNSEPVVSTSPPKRNVFGTSQCIDGLMEGGIQKLKVIPVT